MFKTIACALGLALTAEAGPHLGRCPRNYSPQATLDLDRYVGEWYEIHRDKWTPFEILLGCDTAKYTAQPDGTVSVQNQGHRFIQGWSGVTGTAVVADTGDASLIVSFGGNVPSPSDTPNYTVLSTDYETYSIVYGCGNIMGVASWDFLWILSRTPEISDQDMLTYIGIIEDKLPSYEFFKNSIETRQGRTCPYDKQPE